MREHKVPCGNKGLRESAKFLKKCKGFVSEHKVSWGKQRFCEGAQSFLGNAKVL